MLALIFLLNGQISNVILNKQCSVIFWANKLKINIIQNASNILGVSFDRLCIYNVRESTHKKHVVTLAHDYVQISSLVLVDCVTFSFSLSHRHLHWKITNRKRWPYFNFPFQWHIFISSKWTHSLITINVLFVDRKILCVFKQ